MTPDGVYTTWVDQDMGDRGVDIILATLDEAFDECWLAYLKSSYYLLMCSNAPMFPHQREAVVRQPELRRYFAEREALPLSLLPYSILSTRALHLPRDPGTPVNTMDFRTLDHAMARVRSRRILNFNGRLQARLDLRDLARSIPPAWDAAEFLLWRRLRESDESTLSGMLERAVAREFGPLGEGWTRAVVAAAKEVDTAPGYESFADRLRDEGSWAAAAELYERALALDPGSMRARYYLAACLEELGERGRAIEQYRGVLPSDPHYARARDALERLATAGG
jgi:tetratricopeptide (TPR) repeat protein